MTVTSLILVVLAMLVVGTVAWLAGRHRRRSPVSTAQLPARIKPTQSVSGGEPDALPEEEQSKVELENVQQQIRARKRLAWESDISHHLWSLYMHQFRALDAHSNEHYTPGERWYELKILQSGSKNNLRQFEFELNGARYRFVDDEDAQGWCENLKYFSLFLYDESGDCLIEVPMKVRVDRWGSTYSISSDAPAAFLPGGWVNDFVNATLKHQSIRNQEIRAQKHQERLWEIEDLKHRFGLSD